MPKISIIVPAYNAKYCLRRTVESILKQTIEDIELILVNDGSTDGTKELCDELKERDKRIKVFHQLNAGVSAARNSGLSSATGEFVMFCDSDDFVSNHWCEDLLKSVLENESAISVCRMELVSKTKQFDGRNEGMCNDTYEDLYKNGVLHSPCNKIFRRDVLEKHCLRFPEHISYHEDLLFVLDYMICTGGSFSFVDKSLYYYDKDTVGSLSKQYIPQLWSIKKEIYKRLDVLFSKSWQESLAQWLIWDVMDSINSILIAPDIKGLWNKSRHVKLLLTDEWFTKIWNGQVAMNNLPSKTALVMKTKCAALIVGFLWIAKKKSST